MKVALQKLLSQVLQQPNHEQELILDISFFLPALYNTWYWLFSWALHPVIDLHENTINDK